MTEPAPKLPSATGASVLEPFETVVPVRKEGRFHHGDLRQSLLAAAARALAIRGDADISLRELARGLGVTHAAAYRHFAAKSDLLAALAARGWLRLGEVLAAVRADGAGDDESETLRRLAEAYLAFARANPGPYHAMHLPDLRTARAYPDLEVAIDHVILAVSGVVHDGQTVGTLRRDVGAHELAGAVLAALDGAVRAERTAADGPALAAATVDLVVAGARVGRRPSPPPSPPSAPEKRDRRRAEPQSLTLDLFG
jgi:AcrR family transcriptional regulator